MDFSVALLLSKLTTEELLASAVVALSGAIAYLFKLFWSHTTKLEKLLLEASKLQAEQLSQLQQIPDSVRESNRQLLAFIEDCRKLHRILMTKMDTVVEHTASCRVALREFGSPGTSSKTTK